MAHGTDLEEFRRQWQQKRWTTGDIASVERQLKGTLISFHSYGSLRISSAITSFELHWQEDGKHEWQVERTPVGQHTEKSQDKLVLGLGHRKLVLHISSKARLEIRDGRLEDE